MVKREELAKMFREIVGPIVILFDILTPTSLAKLIDRSEREVLTVLGNLHSVLDILES